ncbi:uncharacterized protein LOC124543688 isoform X2 [Vanessa cardui]|uniref:uncharacterized protein LOC124543688 isoform X2 n=1 Tax=Vanessa cardui TaxID=171605 RepID=UPI001F14021D|nr:uncharacterized protein LOC124543688 isoform X2 [Vanessa cardui]
MGRSITFILLAVFISYANSAPQFITFKEGKLGVNFGGYHAGVGLGGLLGGGAAGGLYAEAGTPHGQSARAGLGGVASENGGTSGGLYAGATAGGNVKASAGLAGGVNSEHAVGAGYASAQAGNHYAASGMAGESSAGGASEFSFSGTQEVVPHPVEVKPVHKKIHTEFNFDSINEVQPLPKSPEVHTEVKTEIEKKVIHENVQPVIVKEVYVEPKTKVVQKEIIHTHYKPRRHHFRKTAFLGGYIGGQGDIVAPTVYKNVEPQIQKRIDVDAEASVNAGAAVEGGFNGGAGSSHVYTKQVTIQRNPSFFADIFNIPISTLKAVGNFLGNTAANTNISVQKSATVQAESDTKSLSTDPSLSSSSSSSSSAHVSVETPSASKFIDDILAIPINTLGAVNKFLENNVANRKTVQVAEDGTVEPVRSRRGPHARRRANKQVIVIQDETPEESEVVH